MSEKESHRTITINGKTVVTYLAEDERSLVTLHGVDLQEEVRAMFQRAADEAVAINSPFVDL